MLPVISKVYSNSEIIIFNCEPEAMDRIERSLEVLWGRVSSHRDNKRMTQQLLGNCAQRIAVSPEEA